jgi:ribonuclease E
MKRMLFNATQQEELRVAIVDGQKLIDIDIEAAGREQRKGNIYKGVITRIEPSLEACFVNYGEERHGFLPFKEVARSYFKEGVDVRTASIKDALREGQEIIVQVEKEERGNKGAALTSFISLAGRYLVLMPNNPRGGGVSRRIEGEDRQELREAMSQLEIPEGMSIIARTAGIGRDATELQWDLNYLTHLWGAIDGAAQGNSAPLLIYLESSLVIRAIRDYFQPDIGEILIDTDDIFEQAQAFMSVVMPDNLTRVKRYHDDVPLFSRFQIEHQIETAYSRTVPLPSGGAIVIDHTEALVSVDVNSARATRGHDIEETATRTNLEAADEVARQMRLRDLGGLIVIDFIDMESSKSQKDVENRLRDALRHDRARVQTGKISKFGLMEMSRQRLRPALSEGSHVTCPRCNGTGHIRDTESSALQVLRIIQEEAMKENTAALHCQVPVDVAAFLLNEKRSEVIKIETRFKVNVLLIPNKHLETPHYKLERLRHDDTRLDDQKASYVLADEASKELEADTIVSRRDADAKPRQEAAVKGITPSQPAPMNTPRKSEAKSGGLMSFIKRLFASTPEVTEEEKPRRNNGGRNGNRNNRNQRGDRNQGERNGNRNKKNAEGGDGQNPNRREKQANKPRVEAGEDGQVRNETQGNNRNRRGNRPQGNQNGAEKTETGDQQLANQTPNAPTEAGEGGEEKRRSRNRRNRNRNRDRGDKETSQTQSAGEVNEVNAPTTSAPSYASETETSATPVFNTASAATPSASAPEVATSTAAPAVEVRVETPVAPAVVAAVAPAPIQPKVEAPAVVVVPTPAPELPKVTASKLDPKPLEAVLSNVGMIWVGTNEEKLAEVQRQIAAEPKPTYAPREPKPAPALPEGPMILVETGGQQRSID